MSGDELVAWELTEKDLLEEIGKLINSGMVSRDWEVRPRYVGYDSFTNSPNLLTADRVISVERDWNEDLDNLGAHVVTPMDPLRGDFTVPDALLIVLLRKWADLRFTLTEK